MNRVPTAVTLGGPDRLAGWILRYQVLDPPSGLPNRAQSVARWRLPEELAIASVAEKAKYVAEVRDTEPLDVLGGTHASDAKRMVA